MANLLLGTLATASPGFISSRRNYFWDLFTRFVNTPHRHNISSSIHWLCLFPARRTYVFVRFFLLPFLLDFSHDSPLTADLSVVHAGTSWIFAERRIVRERPVSLSLSLFLFPDRPRGVSSGPIQFELAPERSSQVSRSIYLPLFFFSIRVLTACVIIITYNRDDVRLLFGFRLKKKKKGKRGKRDCSVDQLWKNL